MLRRVGALPGEVGLSGEGQVVQAGDAEDCLVDAVAR
jgi:hypothetical protein